MAGTGAAGYLAQVNSTAAQYGVPASLLASTINTESSGNPGAVSPTGVQGLAQITKATWATLYGPNVPYSIDPDAQLAASATLLGHYYQSYGGNQALVAAAYNGGPGVANQAQQLLSQNPDLSVYDAISQAAGAIYGNGSAKQTEINNYVPKVVNGSVQGSVNQSSTGGNGSGGGPGVNDTDPVAAVPVSGSSASVTSADIEPPYIITAGLSATPWFSDPSILQVDGATNAVPAPVTFAIYFNLDDNPLPVEIRLNASLKTHKVGMRHIMNTQETRTGFMMTLWGMEPDQITGSGSTGVFMNQLGLTDFLSVSDISNEVLGFIREGFNVSPSATSTAVTSFDQESPTGIALTGDSMRIAARDAFVEFLFTFKNNGIVWFRNPSYTGYTSGTDNELGNDAWSPQTGSSTFQNKGRRNDVMTRGGVAMYFRNSVHYGNFKSLSWTLDAEDPFQWNFTFVFQVERTVTAVPVPDTQ